MTKIKICIGTVVYDGAFKFQKDFIDSVNSQTIYKYDVLLINDNLNKDQIDIYKKQINNKVIAIDKTSNLSISELRIFLLSKALEFGYDLIMLADADDKFSEDRLEKIINSYSNEFTFYYNDIYDLNNNLLLKNLPEITDSIEEILECNYLGLSNTAINLTNVSDNYLRKMQNVKTNIFDWYLFSKMLNDHYIGKYVSTAKTFYRLHANNIVGILQLSEDSLKKEISVKLQHYSLLREENEKFNELYIYYSNLKNSKNIMECRCLDPNYNNYWWGFVKKRKDNFN